ncbi:uncharacterized protein DNG_02580 [Cephalotrichum gorgonifer]|uniref:Uncharacterized protein n=1 Tax=Cephalotrichum gorgonifer TaxID=2041049 RepID=A0AAE8STF2_9PEZI|nr:uncharacterized protein DNG_02580 [Cephalotrichum gorgonifer]
MAHRPDENLPEVVPDSSPQPLTYTQEYERRGLDQGDAKYTVIYDSQTPKILTSESAVSDSGTPTSPAPAYRPPVEGAAIGVAAVSKDPGAAAGATADRDVAADPASVDADDPGRSEAALGSEKGGKAEPKILGLKKRTFWIVLILAIVVIAAAAIGGGVGGSQSSKKSKSGADAAGADEPEVDTTPSSTESSPSSTTDSGASASSTGSGDGGNDTIIDAGFDLTVWEDADFKGKTMPAITKTGFLDLPFNATSYKWKPNGTDCCVTFCQGEKKSVGWRCTFFEREESTSVFGRIFVGCGVEGLQENSRCS